MRTVSTVEHLLKDQDGDIRGLMLGDGTIVDTPPGHGDALKTLLKRGDEVRVDGEPSRSRRGRLRVRANKIVMPKGRQFPRSKESIEEIGRVRRFLFNANGMVNGFRLANGTIVKTPVGQSEQILAHLHQGDKVHVEGRESSSNAGKLVADTIHILHHDLNPSEEEPSLRLLNRAIGLLKRQKRILLELEEIQRTLKEREGNRS